MDQRTKDKGERYTKLVLIEENEIEMAKRLIIQAAETLMNQYQCQSQEAQWMIIHAMDDLNWKE